MTKKKKTTKNNHFHDENGDFVKGNEVGFSSHPENINKKGRPPRPSLTRMLNEWFEKGANGKTGEEMMEEFLTAAFGNANEGNAAIMKELWARHEGKVADRIAGHDGGSIKIDDKAMERIQRIVDAADTIQEDESSA
tara:strand:+ start:239 stop:649 length:411 start_codon:yes stop_codon:yes gene_type:complete